MWGSGRINFGRTASVQSMTKIQISVAVAFLVGTHAQYGASAAPNSDATTGPVLIADVPLPPSADNNAANKNASNKNASATDADAKNGKPLWKSRVKETPTTVGSTTTKRAQTGRFDPAELDQFLQHTERKIKRHWFPPKANPSKAITLQFTLNDAGEVSNVKVTKSSGMEICDKAAIEAVVKAQPFHKLPAGAHATEELRFHFDYRVFDPKDKSAISVID